MQINIYYIQKLKQCDRTKCLHADADFAILTYLLTMVCIGHIIPKFGLIIASFLSLWGLSVIFRYWTNYAQQTGGRTDRWSDVQQGTDGQRECDFVYILFSHERKSCKIRRVLKLVISPVNSVVNNLTQW